MTDAAAPPAKGTKPDVDWERVEREYRGGQLSTCEIARQQGPGVISEGAIRKRARKEGWVRDLTARVNAAVRTETVRAAVRDANPQTDREIVKEFAQRGAAVAELQRGDIRKSRERISAMGDMLDKLLAGEVVDADLVQRVLGKESLIDATDTLVRSLYRVIAMERRAWNLDGGANEDDDAHTALTDADLDKRIAELQRKAGAASAS